MSMHWLEQQLRESGDPVDQERANIIAAMLLSREEDVPLPEFPIETNDAHEASGGLEKIEEVTHSAGFLALNYGDDCLLGKSTEELIRETTNLETLLSNLKSKAVPFENLINYLLPQQTRGSLKLRDKESTRAWDFDTTLRDLPVNTRVTLQYTQGKNNNRANSLSASLDNSDGTINVTLFVADGGLEKIRVNARGSNPRASLAKIFNGTSLGALLDKMQENKLSGPNRINLVEAGFNLLDPKLFMKVNFWMRHEGESRYHGTGKAVLGGVFVPGNNELVIEKNDKLLWRSPETESLTRLTPEEYVELVGDALSVIPVVSTKY